MTTAVSDQHKWKQLLRQQSLNNAKLWLKRLEESSDKATLVMTDYDNILRALESTLHHDTFELALQIIYQLHLFVLGYADVDRWLAYLEKALTVSFTLDQQAEQARLLECIGGVFKQIGQLEEAEKRYWQAIETYQTVTDQAGYARTLATLAIIRAQKGHNGSIEMCQKALSEAKAIANPRLVADITLNLSRIHTHFQNWHQALATAQTAYTYYQQHDLTQSITALVNMVAAWANIGEWEKIGHNATQLTYLLTETGDIRRLSWLKNNEGIAAYHQGYYRKAEIAWQEAYRLNSQMKDPVEQANVMNNLGMVYTKLNEWETAQEMLEKAISVYDEVGDTYNWANALDNLADLYEVQGNYETCRQVLTIAIRNLEEIEPSASTKQLLQNIRERLAVLTD